MSSGAVVLGMHRSGTSLVAEMLHRCGSVGRAEECLPADRWNARGYWELSSLVHFNERLLADVGSTWTLPPSRTATRRLESFADIPEYRAQASGLLRHMRIKTSDHWFWKDPRLSLLLPFWQKFWGNIRYVICVRDPYEICRSLHERDGLSFKVSLALWQSYMLSVLEWTRTTPRIFLNYSKILQAPSQESRRLSEFLGAANPSTMTKVVDHKLNHCAAEKSRSDELLSTSQKELRRVLVNLADTSHPPTDLDLSRCALPRTWRASLRTNLFLLRCQKYWSRTFPAAPVSPPAEEYSKAFLNRSNAAAGAYDLP